MSAAESEGSHTSQTNTFRTTNLGLWATASLLAVCFLRVLVDFFRAMHESKAHALPDFWGCAGEAVVARTSGALLGVQTQVQY